MILVSTAASIFFFALLAWLFNKILRINICPICAGTASTWIWMLAAHFAGYDIDPIVLGILMGGSVVGVAYLLERNIASPIGAMLWKMIFIPVGFAAVYGIVKSQWTLALIAILVLAIAIMFARKQHRMTARDNQKIQELEQKMKRCC